MNAARSGPPDRPTDSSPGSLITDDGSLVELLRRTQTIAVVGVSANPMRASNEVAAYLQRHAHYDLYFVNPFETEILGRPVVPSLSELPLVPDLVDVFRKTDELAAVTDEAIAIGATSLWFQLGLVDDAAAARAVAAGLDVVQDRCIKVDHARHRDALPTRS